jgi:diaminopimelate epimerase
VKVEAEGRAFEAISVDMGNPHAVTFVESLDEAGALHEAPRYDAEDFPAGVNVEFAVRRGDRALAMRVFERGVGETQSCGTGACAVAAAAAHLSAARSGAGTTYTVEVSGGTLTVSRDDHGHLHLKGPAVLVAEGTWTL